MGLAVRCCQSKSSQVKFGLVQNLECWCRDPRNGRMRKRRRKTSKTDNQNVGPGRLTD
ncbi:hypothetical protein VFPPC_15644 [Pochonia chlamydosporia 170]|uniref:Uncharacterized protein n=1 Tax=Pochonia chlamydosporia 170 TaxID=1380566 RepID=A0A179G107_METCM|nr:hypothetical protein VFPPC_15644 [Pochonia chlamydosporia 170]OAQ71013.1 hypothetical protein VFPPC_15644 [Pochonia chlamydosporia 170]